MRSEVGINIQPLPYGFQNEIMDHPCSDGGPGSNRIECTKFYKGCTKFSKVCFEVGIDNESLPLGSQLKLWTLGVHMGVPKAIGLYVPNFIKDVPNFVMVVPNFIDTHRRYLKIYLD